MKNIQNILKLAALAFLIVGWVGCQEDSVDPAIQGIAIEDNDVIQVDDSNPNVPVSFTAKSSDLNTVVVKLIPQDGGDEVYSNTLHGITADNLNRVKLDVPFPTPDLAPSGKYTVSLSINGNESGSSFLTYSVNILNNRTIKYCDFPNAPNGKVGVFVSVPGGDEVAAAEKDIYIVGDFMEKNGAAGNWNPGNPDFKLTKISTNCYYILLDKFDSGDNFKFTLGNWDTELLGPKGEGMGNQVAKGGNLNYTIYNFKTLPVTQYSVPELLPSAAIKTGHITIVANVNSEDNSTYYLVKQGATSLDGAIKMDRVVGTSKVAGAVPKEAGVVYNVVRNNIQTIGVNYFDAPSPISINGVTNPVTGVIRGFRGEMSIATPPDNLFIVGGATPGSWSNPVPTPSQQFTKSGNVFTLTLELKANEGYLLLPVNGSWDKKYGMGGDSMSGDIVPQGGDFSSPAEAGTYLITADFTTGRYTLVKQ